MLNKISIILYSQSINPQKVTYETVGYRIGQKYIYVNNCCNRHHKKIKYVKEEAQKKMIQII